MKHRNSSMQSAVQCITVYQNGLQCTSIIAVHLITPSIPCNAQKVNCSTFQMKPQGQDSHSEMKERSCLKMLKPKVAWIISKKISWDGIKQTIEIYEQGIVAIVCSTTKGLYTFHVKLCNSGYFLLDFLQQSTFSFLAFGFDVAIWGISEKKINKSYQ